MRALLCIALLGCDVSLQTSTGAIIGGVAAPDDHAVVALAPRSISCEPSLPSLECTGTLITPSAIVTAAHCLADQAPNALEAAFGPEYSSSPLRIPIVAGRAHPDFDRVTHANDIAVLILAVDVPTTPVPIVDVLPDVNGTMVRLVGYGITASTASEVGSRHSGTAQVSGVDDNELRLVPSPAMSCQGDSGGPVLADLGGEKLVGVTSWGDPACTQFGVAMRVDRHAGFIQSVIAEANASATRRAFDASEHFCRTTCETDADCPAETVCFGEPRRCVYRGLPAGELGERCTQSGPCACVAMPDGSCREYLPCVADEDDVCRADPGCGCQSGGSGSALLALLVLGVALWPRRHGWRGGSQR